MRRWSRVLLWLFSLYLFLCTATALFLVHTTLYPNRRPLPATAKEEMQDLAVRLQSQLYDVGVTAADGAILRAWYIRPNHENASVVLLLHGLGDNRLGTVGYAEIFVSHGYSVLMPDARAHGTSGGNLATYGVLERNDIEQWFGWLETADHPRCVFGLGESMGAAQLLQSLELEPNFCAVIAESSFANFREIAYDRTGQQFHAGPWVGRTLFRPVVEIALAYVRWKYGVDLARASPQEVVAYTHVPVLLIHGAQDRNIPAYHSRLIKMQNSNVDLWEVPGADHCGAISVARAQFERRVLDWFETHRHRAPTKLEPVIAIGSSDRRP